MDKKEDEKIPDHVACVVSYYDPKSKNKDFCRMAFAITDLRTDIIVFQKEYWTKDCKLSPKEISNEIIEMVKKYNAKIFHSKKLEPLEKCQCGNCDGYYFDSISRENYLAMENNAIKITQGGNLNKKEDKFGSKLFDSYEEFADDTFEKMDKGWNLPLLDDGEIDIIYQMAKDYLMLILEENDEAPEGNGKSLKDLNEMYQLLFKLFMLTPDEDEEGEEENEEEEVNVKKVKDGEVLTAPAKTSTNNPDKK